MNEKLYQLTPEGRKRIKKKFIGVFDTVAGPKIYLNSQKVLGNSNVLLPLGLTHSLSNVVGNVGEKHYGNYLESTANDPKGPLKNVREVAAQKAIQRHNFKGHIDDNISPYGLILGGIAGGVAGNVLRKKVIGPNRKPADLKTHITLHAITSLPGALIGARTGRGLENKIRYQIMKRKGEDYYAK